MKKYYIKTIPALLIAVILPMSGGFCFQTLLGSAVKVKTALATGANSQSVGETDICGRELVDEPAAVSAIIPARLASAGSQHDSSLLPCCIESGQSSAVILSRLSEIEKFIPALLFVREPLSIKAAPKTIIYHVSNLSPPGLLALETTILRL